jgi:hypothetical protein
LGSLKSIVDARTFGKGESMKTQGYDIIGDIHGHADELLALLTKLDYSYDDGCYRHACRKIIFLGDFIDRGPKQREVLQIVMPMVQQECALAVMGNHEFNALAFHTEVPGSSKHYLRARTNKNIQQHLRFLDEYLNRKDELKSVLDFFWSLPLWLDLGGIRIIHACWEENHIEALESESQMTQALLVKASTEGGPPPKRWSTPIVRKGRIKDGEQTAQTGGNCNQATAG